MKTVYILIGLLVIGGIFYFVSGDESAESPTPVVEESVTEVMETEEVATEEVAEAIEDDGEMMEEESVEAEVEATERVFTLDSFNFGYSETEIRVNEGDTVTINLTNSDGFHDWVVDEFSAATEKISAGGQTSVTFVADQTGTFEYYCSVGSHRANGMVGNLIVE